MITIEEIQEIKNQAEIMISKIITKTEEKTNCVCNGVDIFINHEDDKLLIDLDLRIKNKNIL